MSEANSDPYRSPLHYDLEYEDQTDDIDWYVALARRTRGPVLELGCGNGRITLPMARAGVEVHGLDRNRRMLDDLERKLRTEEPATRMRVRWSQGDFTQLEVEDRHPLVLLPFNTLHHCTSHRDLLAVLRGVRQALRPGGRFALDCYLPDPILYDRDPDERYGERTFKHPRTGEVIESWERSHYDPLTQIHHVTYVYEHDGGSSHQVNLPLRVFYPQELRALLDWGGFEIESEHGGFDGRPLTAQSSKWVMVLRPRS